MKKFLLIPLLFSFHFAFAGTGGAKDENLVILSIIAVIASVLAVLYAIEFTRRIIKKHKEKRIAQLSDNTNNENIS